VVLQYADASDPTQFFGLLANQSADVTPFDWVEWERLIGVSNLVRHTIREKK
jgi:hypothetical protein